MLGAWGAFFLRSVGVGFFKRKQQRNFVTIVGSITYNPLFSRNRKACVFADIQPYQTKFRFQKLKKKGIVKINFQ